MFQRLYVLATVLLIVFVPSANSEDRTPSETFAENLVLITIDGLRPEEFFGGADRRLFLEDLGVKDPSQADAKYCRDTRAEARKALMPFVWQQIEDGGWAAGDWKLDSRVTVTNGLYFSYPGYQEILCGFADPAIDSNNKNYNRNQTVLEWLHRRPEFAGRVMAFASWDVFPFIINDRRSGIPVNAGWQSLETGEPAAIATLNFVADHLFHEWEGVRFDAFTAGGALEAMRTVKPRVLYVALGEPDDWAHAGRYDRYLLTSSICDSLIQQLWLQSQAIAEYSGKTAFLITTDHGRGDGREGWKSHGSSLPGSENIWVAAFGAGLAERGTDNGGRYTQSQIAATAAAMLGLDLTAENAGVAPTLPIVSRKQ